MPATHRPPSVPSRRKSAMIPEAKKKTLFWIVGAAAVAFCVLVLYLSFHWPFRESEIVSSLEDAGSGKVEIRSFHKTYFPYPGCVAEGTIYRLAPNAPPLAVIERLTIQSNWLGLLGKRLRLIQADGMQVFVPAPDAKAKFKGLRPGSTAVDKIVIRQGALEVPRKEPGQKLIFQIHELTLDSSGLNGPIHFSTKVSNPEPPGEVVATGQFGPWKGKETPVSGDYIFEHAELGEFEGIAGLLSSKGKFGGSLEHITASGAVDVPDFELKKVQHKLSLESNYTAYVSGLNGDTFLNQVTTQFFRTRVTSEGRIAGTSGQKGKTAIINFESREGRIEDLLRMFARAAQPSMSGAISFQGKAILPPGKERFLEKIQLQGDFGVFDSKFSKPATQQKVNELSQNAKKDDDKNKEKEKNKKQEKDTAEKEPGKSEGAANAPPVLSDVRGNLVVKSGVATFSDLSFYIPGAHARMHGTYNLISEKIDFHGTLKMDAELAQASSGPKSVILKVIQPFFKRKKHEGSEVPVKMTGDYDHPSFGIDMAAAGKHAIKAGN